MTPDTQVQTDPIPVIVDHTTDDVESKPTQEAEVLRQPEPEVSQGWGIKKSYVIGALATLAAIAPLAMRAWAFHDRCVQEATEQYEDRLIEQSFFIPDKNAHWQEYQ